MLMITWFAQRRAIAAGISHYKHGMYFDNRRHMLVGTKTPVYSDPKTGVHFLGKTEKHD